MSSLTGPLKWSMLVSTVGAMLCAGFPTETAAAGATFARTRTLHRIETAGPEMLVLCFTDSDTNPAPSQKPADYSVGGHEPVKVGRHSATVYEEKCTDWRAQRYPQILGHRIYLQLAQSLVEGATYEIRYDGGTTSLTFRTLLVTPVSAR